MLRACPIFRGLYAWLVRWNAVARSDPARKGSLKIVRARAEQAGALTGIAVRAKRHWGYPEAWIEAWAPLLTVTPEFLAGHETYVAELDGEAIAFYALSFDGQSAGLEHLWVLPEVMGRGLGSRLFAHALARCRVAGVRVIEIESDPHALGFYERLGACRTGERRADMGEVTRALPVLQVDTFVGM